MKVAIAIKNALEKNTSLTHLDLKENSIGDEIIIAIKNSLKKSYTKEVAI